ncbi:hypothetical protein A9Q91_04640 [Candidatus Gracilibacteria bacterium 28_42_T64]|nr:hypothetical protein A9Q91_04640 [Candidatus Gracilibacteria bacterium 28_42_T64]
MSIYAGQPINLQEKIMDKQCLILERNIESIKIEDKQRNLTPNGLLEIAYGIVIRDFHLGLKNQNNCPGTIEYFFYLLSLHSGTKGIFPLKEASDYILENETMPDGYNSTDIRDFDVNASIKEKIAFIEKLVEPYYK